MPYKDKEKQRTYQRKWLKARREKWIKENGPCVNCGSDKDLEIDHIDPKTKEIKPTHLWNRAEKVREVELSKCQVLCGDCHLGKTISQFKKPLSHGDRNGYVNHKCRCNACCAWKSAENALRYV